MKEKIKVALKNLLFFKITEFPFLILFDGKHILNLGGERGGFYLK